MDRVNLLHLIYFSQVLVISLKGLGLTFVCEIFIKYLLIFVSWRSKQNKIWPNKKILFLICYITKQNNFRFFNFVRFSIYNFYFCIKLFYFDFTNQKLAKKRINSQMSKTKWSNQKIKFIYNYLNILPYLIKSSYKLMLVCNFKILLVFLIILMKRHYFLCSNLINYKN